MQNMNVELVAQMFKNYQSNVLFHLEGQSIHTHIHSSLLFTGLIMPSASANNTNNSHRQPEGASVISQCLTFERFGQQLSTTWDLKPHCFLLSTRYHA